MKILLFCVLAALSSLASAQNSDESLDFDTGLRNFGFTSGAVHQCSDKDRQVKVEHDVLKAYSGIVRLFGSDHAFFYAASFGAGSQMAIDRSKCDEYKASFAKSMKQHSGK